MKMPKNAPSATDEQIKQGIQQATKGSPAEKAKIMAQVAEEGGLQAWYRKSYDENREDMKKVMG
jgi:hypothetical protein